MTKNLAITFHNVPRRVKVSEKRKGIPFDKVVFEGGIKLKTKKNKEPAKKYFTDPNKYAYQLKDDYTVAFKVDKKIVEIPKFILGACNSVEAFYRACKSGMELTEKQYERGKFLITKKGTSNIVYANPNVAGMPRYEVINYQKLYNGGYHPITRAKIVNAIKEYYAPILLEKRLEIKAFIARNEGKRLMVDMALLMKTEVGNWDVGNRTNIYMKCFLDILAKGYEDDNISVESFIVDDNVKVIASERATHIEFITDTPKMVFMLYPFTLGETAKQLLLGEMRKF